MIMKGLSMSTLKAHPAVSLISRFVKSEVLTAVAMMIVASGWCSTVYRVSVEPSAILEVEHRLVSPKRWYLCQFMRRHIAEVLTASGSHNYVLFTWLFRTWNSDLPQRSNP